MARQAVIGLVKPLGSITRAEELFQDWMHGGWFAMISRFCGVDLEEHRLQWALDANAIHDEEAQQRIEVLVRHLRMAAHETSVELPLRRLLSDRPSSKRRLNFGRSIWFGFSNIVKRKQQWRRKYRGVVRPIKKIVLLENTEDDIPTHPTPEDRLALSFSGRATLSVEDARQVIRSVGTSSLLGFVPKDEWFDLIHPAIIEYIELIKFGHIEGAVNFGVLREQIKSYAGTTLGISPLSAQVLRTLYNSMRKPSRWNAGTGPAVDGVVLRATPLRDARRLHKVWLVEYVRLRLLLVDETNKILSDICHVLLVLEEGTERPMGCWVSVKAPSEVELALAIYQSLWHPWIPDWPIRGIPERIIVPASLSKNLVDLNRAADFLLTKLEVVTDEIWKGPRDEQELDIASELRIFGPDYVRQMFGVERLTCAQVQEGLLHYLRWHEKAFPFHHIAPLDSKLEAVGLGMPGYTMPAAGWLLPVSEPVFSLADGVVFDGLLYTNTWVRFQHGQILKRRAFPYMYPHRSPGFFIEDEAGVPHYVWLID